jgi:YHYH protein
MSRRRMSFRLTPVELSRLEDRVTPTSVPLLNTWLTGDVGQFAKVISQSNVAAGPTTTWSGQTTAVLGDVQKISYSSTYAYVNVPDLASYVMGPWFLANGSQFPNYPKNQNAIDRFPLTPQPATSHTATPLGAIGIAVNGVSLFNMLDAFSWNNTTQQDVGNGSGYWNRTAEYGEGLTLDHGHGHQPQSGEYHYHDDPTALRTQLGDNIAYTPSASSNSASVEFPYDTVATHAQTFTHITGLENASQYEENTTGLHHSALLGWAFDGYPVYGPYGYSDPNNASSPVQLMTSSYSLRNITTRTTLPGWAAQAKFGDTVTLNANGEYALASNFYGPAVSATHPLGEYAEDYQYVSGAGTLDKYNGRFTVTPDYPSGTYAYFVTVDSTGDTQFPYILGRQYYGQVLGGKVTSITESVTTKFDITSTVTTPTDQNSTANQVAKYSANGTQVGISANSTTSTGTVAYSLTDSAGGRFAINSTTGIVTVANGSLLTSVSSYTITVEANNGVGPTSTANFTINVLADTIAPTTTITSQPPAFTNNTSASFSFTGADPLFGGIASGVNHLEYSLDASAFAASTSPVTLNSLADGNHIFQVRAVDNAGNVGSPQSYAWTVDATPPTVAVVGPSVLTTATGPVDYAVNITDANFDPFTLTIDDFSMNATGSAAGTLTLAGTGNSRTLTVSGISGSGTLGVTLAAASIADLAGNTNVGSTAGSTFAVVPTPPSPSVSNFTVNGADASLSGVQRSRVTNLVVVFDQVVELGSTAFHLSLNVNGTTGQTAGTIPSLSWTNPSADGKTWVMTFSGNGVVAGSIANGVYDLNIDHTQVNIAGYPGTTMAADYTATFHRLFGDADGDRAVSAGDFVYFRSAFNGISAMFDFDDDSAVSVNDFIQFRNRFGTDL